MGSAIAIQYDRKILYKKSLAYAVNVYKWIKPRWNKELINLQEQCMAFI